MHFEDGNVGFAKTRLLSCKIVAQGCQQARPALQLALSPPPLPMLLHR